MRDSCSHPLATFDSDILGTYPAKLTGQPGRPASDLLVDVAVAADDMPTVGVETLRRTIIGPVTTTTMTFPAVASGVNGGAGAGVEGGHCLEIVDVGYVERMYSQKEWRKL